MTITLADSSYADSNTVTWPSGVQAGDIAILWVEVRNASDTTPTGWTKIASRFTSNGSRRESVFYRITDGTETGDFTALPTTVGDFQYSALAIYRESKGAILTANLQQGDIAQSSGSINSRTIDSGDSTSPPVLAFAIFSVSTTLSTISFSPTEDLTYAPTTEVEFRTKSFYSSPTDISLSLADGGSYNSIVWGYIEYTHEESGGNSNSILIGL